MNTSQRDQYGGWTELQFEATGFFRLEKTDRWWLVTPEGNAFLSYGINHTMPQLLLAEYNREHWTKEFGIDPESDLQSILPHFEKKVKSDFEFLGMNTLGCHTPLHLYSKSFVPYVAQIRFVDICHYMTPTEEDFRDVYSDDFVAHCEQIAREKVVPNDPYALGYSMTDCPVLTDMEALPRNSNFYGSERIELPTWPCVLRNLGEESPGKHAYVRKMREIYEGNIQTFNRSYNTGFESFEDVLRARNWRPRAEYSNSREARDNRQFLIDVVDKCYEVEVAAIRKFDSTHLILGDKFNGNMDVPDEIIALHGKHFDLVFFQFYSNWYDLEALLNRFERVTGKAILHGDSSFSSPKENMPDPYGPQCVNQEVRARHFVESFYGAFSRPDFVGWDWCGWMDNWQAFKPGKQHSGIQDPFGNFDQPIVDAMRRFSEEMYSLANGDS
ncbi:MAG: hypothetical protein QGG64_22020 [Candidatus Latescibacteria bacterium]|jgi:hypothetical protein|nr:hypothetical protein [Candidatus Latescibacterota bacterium]